MLQAGHQGEGGDDVQDHRADRHQHRRLGVEAGEKSRLEDFDQNEGRQAKREDRQGGGGGGGHFGGESAALEQHHDHRLGDDEKRGGGRQGDQHAELQRSVLGGQGAAVFAALDLPRQQRQQGGANRHANHAQRQLRDAVGVIQVGDRAGGQGRGQDHVDHLVDVNDPGAKGGRRH